MRVLALAGWAQPHDALHDAFPDATHLQYAHLPTMQQALELIAKTSTSHDVVVGWSLGGRLAAQTALSGLIPPKKLVLIASAFQFSKSTELLLGIPPEQYEKFRGNYQRNALRTLDKGWELIIKGDSRAEQIRTRFTNEAKQSMLTNDWLRWLDDLNGFTFHGKNLKAMPPTLLLHGCNDVVVAPEQSQHFASLLPQSKLVMYKECGHAPHWHDPAAVQKVVKEFAHV